MNATHSSESAALTTSGIAAVNTGIGVVTFALFPFLLPILLLTAVFVVPLALLSIVPVLAVGIVAGAGLGIRAIWRRMRRGRVGGPGRAPSPVRPAHRVSGGIQAR
jgi:hypothetical protein